MTCPRAELALANAIVAHEGVVDAWGHVSIRKPGSADDFLLSAAVPPSLVTEDDILDLDVATGEVVGGGKSYLERHVHAAIYRVRPDVGAVVHCHTAELLPFGVAGRPIVPLSHTDAFLADGCPVFEIRDARVETDTMLVDSGELGDALARALGSAPVILMRGHGATVVGADLREAVYRAIYLRHAAALQLAAISLGDVRPLSDAEAREMAKALGATADRSWNYWRSRISASPLYRRSRG
ncbi:MAG: class II aldolase/adducin family protein [Microbacterium sp.]|uniref:class II aldolase/adducin family protein n=1 Tax=Microbacterium sp. TaxID=51671 RepID=UPI001AC6E584|nr:class II aldolase/adducin family protein [Microbacterium sp.]MBN9155789.1 class II aldolase/adducin family protein [Microbacterium sp.]MBN9175665.1 class II aldolase/adducin family protein [Microbacterium sp.]